MIHPTSIIEKGAKIHESVKIGPFCYVGSQVDLDQGTELISSVNVVGQTKIGRNTKIYPFACIGFPPQDLKHKGENSSIEMGDNNIIREYVTISPGTQSGRAVTTLGNNCFIMIGAHIAHDCAIGNDVVITNHTNLGGHVTIGDYVIIGGLTGVHQFVRIGNHVMVGGMTALGTDVIPYAIVSGNRGKLTGLNLVGLKRRGFNQADIQNLRLAYQMLFDASEIGLTFADRVEQVASQFQGCTPVTNIIQFIKDPATRNLCTPND